MSLFVTLFKVVIRLESEKELVLTNKVSTKNLNARLIPILNAC